MYKKKHKGGTWTRRGRRSALHCSPSSLPQAAWNRSCFCLHESQIPSPWAEYTGPILAANVPQQIPFNLCNQTNALNTHTQTHEKNLYIWRGGLAKHIKKSCVNWTYGLENNQNKTNHLNESYRLNSWLGTTFGDVRLKGLGWFLHSSLNQFV